ncbi:MAG: mevalonate kinase [Methanobrevibacter sp.]|jgi:mevalonate kinase|nr:mevalonate kinase [Candidatus Methanovirga basalitermitum]
MESIASAPGKIILFGEHAVIYDQPAIATAVDKKATISIKKSQNDFTTLKSYDLDFEARLNTENKTYDIVTGRPGIIRYILETLYQVHDHSPIDIILSMDFPIGSGLGSSAAVTVATLAALYGFHNKKFSKKTLAHNAHYVEKKVQGTASPLDTSISTHAGLIYLGKDKKVSRFNVDFKSAFVIGYTSRKRSTSKVINQVSQLKNRCPDIVNSIIKTMGLITEEAKLAILKDDKDKIGELMNINQGLLDSIGVNTSELSRMIYLSRKYGALGSKITGAGGGGSMIAYCPTRSGEVYHSLRKYDNAIKVNISHEGITLKTRE